MYNLPYFKESDAALIINFIKQHAFALITGVNGNNIPVATQLPFLIKERAGKLYLQAHIMRNTDHHKAFEKNPNGWCDSLRNNYYAYPALPPPMPWIDNKAPQKPTIKKVNDGINTLVYNGKEKIKGYAVFVVDDKQEATLKNAKMVQLIVQGKVNELDALKWFNQNKRVFISTVDWNNNVSEWVEIK